MMDTHRRAFLMLLVAGVGVGCSDDPAGPSIGEEFQLRSGERVWIEEAALQVRFVTVEEDSRCPRRAQCVWAGDGSVLLELAPVEGDSHDTQLHTNADVGPTSVDVGGRLLVLLGLGPYPEGPPIPLSEYRVTLILQPHSG